MVNEEKSSDNPAVLLYTAYQRRYGHPPTLEKAKDLGRFIEKLCFSKEEPDLVKVARGIIESHEEECGIGGSPMPTAYHLGSYILKIYSK